jgi:hypothetical protein
VPHFKRLLDQGFESEKREVVGKFGILELNLPEFENLKLSDFETQSYRI